MSAFVLVPGFWLGAWAWEEVAGELRAAGHEVHPVTLPGLAERVGEGGPETNVDTHVADLLRVLGELDAPGEVVLVAHSGANMPVTVVADRVPELLAHVVYVDSGPMPDGMAQADFQPEARPQLDEQIRTRGDGWKIPVPAWDDPDDPMLAGLSPGQLLRMRERGTPQPAGTATQPIRRPNRTPDTPTSMIACTITPEQVRALADSGHPVFAPMAAMDLHHLPTGHWPMLSRPVELAALLDRIARDHTGAADRRPGQADRRPGQADRRPAQADRSHGQADRSHVQ